MSKWTARLAVNAKTERAHEQAPSKPSKGAFEPFEGSHIGHFSEIASPFEGFEGSDIGHFSEISLPSQRKWEARLAANAKSEKPRLQAPSKPSKGSPAPLEVGTPSRGVAGIHPAQMVRCGDCHHFIRDRINPTQGGGDCAAGVEYKAGCGPWPNVTRFCTLHRPAVDNSMTLPPN